MNQIHGRSQFPATLKSVVVFIMMLLAMNVSANRLYHKDSTTLPVLDLNDHFSGLFLSEDQSENPASVDYFEMVFNKNLDYNEECEELCTLSHDGKVIKTFGIDDMEIFNIACGCYIDENGELVSYEMCSVSVPLDSPLNISGTYTFTIPDNFLTRGYEQTKGVSGTFTIINEQSAIAGINIDPYVTVFTMTGQCLLKEAPATSLSTLPPDLYIVNGKKMILK